MSALDPPCPRGKEVFLSKPRVLVNLDESLIVDVDVMVEDGAITLVFRRKQDTAIEYCGAFRGTSHDDRVHRVRYVHELPVDLLTLARDRALDACAEHDAEPLTERRGRHEA